MKDTVEVAVIQMDVAWLDPSRNREHMVELVHQALRSKKVDLVVFPELCNSGYVKGRDKDFGARFAETAEMIPGPSTEALGHVAKEYGLHIVVGLCLAHPEIPATMYNSAVLIGPNGEVLGVHHKAHLPAEEKHYFYEGNLAQVFKTEIGSIGLMVCYDNWYPEMARILTLKGAEILCGSFNSPVMKPPVPGRLEALAMVRANENRNFVVFSNRVGVEDETIFFGHSVVTAPTVEVIARSDTAEEEILYATLNRSLLVEQRAYQPVFRDRRPEMYGEISKPF